MANLIKSEFKEAISIDVTVTPENIQNDLFKIYNQLFECAKEDLVYQECRGGFVNSIYRLYLKKDQSKSLVFRTFGFKLDNKNFEKDLKDENKSNNEENKVQKSEFDINSLFNRTSEYEVMNEISKYGLCQRVYARYNNGIAYGFATGVVLNGPLMLTMDYLVEMTKKLARFHSIKFDVPGAKFNTHFERMNQNLQPMFQQMTNVIEDKMSKINEFPFNCFPSIKSIVEDENQILDVLKKIGMEERICFSHNDLNQKNIIWDYHNRTLSFIDFEMVLNNYVSLEIGQHFYCYTGHFLYDFEADFFPNEEYRKLFLKLYLEEYNKLNDIKMNLNEFEKEVEKLFIQTNLASLFHMIRMIILMPLFDFSPDLFKNEDLIEVRKSTKYYCAKFGYKVFKLYEELKPSYLEQALKYIESNKQQ